MKFKLGDTVRVIQVEHNGQHKAGKVANIGRVAQISNVKPDSYAYPYLLDLDDTWLYNERELAHVYEGLPEELFTI